MPELGQSMLSASGSSLARSIAERAAVAPLARASTRQEQTEVGVAGCAAVAR
jgi:hypothetical protein